MALELLTRPTEQLDGLSSISGELIQIQTNEPTVNGMHEKEWPIMYLLKAADIRNNTDQAIRAVVQSKVLTPHQRNLNMRRLLALK